MHTRIPLGQLRSGSQLFVEYGIPDDAVVDAVRKKVRVEDIRPEDLDELRDSLYALGYTDQEIFGHQFGSLLSLSLGFGFDPNVRYYAIGHDSEYLFVGTIMRPVNAVATLCGFGLNRGYELMSRADIYHAIGILLGRLMTDMVDTFGITCAVCNVKATNTRTLAMWRFMARKPQTFRDCPVVVNVIDNPFARDYKLVTLKIGA